MYSAYDAERGVPPEEHIAAPRLWRFPYARRSIAMISGNTGAFTTPLGTSSLEVGVGTNSGEFKIETYSNRTYATLNAQSLVTSARSCAVHPRDDAEPHCGRVTPAPTSGTQRQHAGRCGGLSAELSSSGVELSAGGRTRSRGRICL